jgi:hypothetical protein
MSLGPIKLVSLKGCSYSDNKINSPNSGPVCNSSASLIKLFFLENSFKLSCFVKVFGKIASPTTHEGER